MLKPRDALIALLLALPLVAGLPGKGFWGAHGEGRRAEVAREIYESGRWAVPTLLGEPFVTKPPLHYWALASSFALTGGVDEFRARLPGLLATVGTLLLVLGMSRRLGPAEGAHAGAGSGEDGPSTAGLVFASTPLVIEMGRNAETEPLLLFCTALSVFAFLSIRPGGRAGQSLGWRALFALALAAGFMVKGPLGWIFPGIGAAAMECLSPRGSRRLRWTDAALFVGVHAALVLPWFVSVAAQVPGAWNIWLGESVARMADPDFATHREPFWYYLPALGSFAPWVLLLPAALIELPSALRRRDARRAWPLLWLAGGVVFLSLAASKRAHYLLSLAPAVALAVAPPAASEPATGRAARWGRAAIRALAWTLPAALVLALADLRWLGTDGGGLRSPAAAFGALGLLLALGLLRRPRLPVFVALSLCLGGTLAEWGLTPPLDRYRSPEHFYQSAERLIPPGESVANWRNDRYSASFYLHRFVLQETEVDALSSHLPTGGWLLGEEKEIKALGPAAEVRLREELHDPFRPERVRVWVLARWSPPPEGGSARPRE